MKLIKCFFLTAVIILTGCNIPQKNLTPSEDVVATVVSMTITAKPSHTPESTYTPVPLTPTQPLSSATPRPSATGTMLPADFVTALGSPTIKDNLDSGKGFGIDVIGYEDESVRIFVENNSLVLSSVSTNGWRSWRVRPPELQNFYIEGTFITETCQNNDQYGLLLRTPSYDSGQGYYLGLTCDGKYNFARWDSAGTTMLVPSTDSTNIHTGSGQSNRLGILAENDTFKVFINREEEISFSDSSFQKGYFGVFISSYSGGLKVRLDDISIWTRP